MEPPAWRDGDLLRLRPDRTRPRAGLWAEVARRALRFHMLLNVAGIDYEGPFDERIVDELHTIVRLNIEATVAMSGASCSSRTPPEPCGS